MKTFPVSVALAMVCLSASNLDAQYKAPSQYFRKDSPRNPPPNAPATPTKPAAPAQRKFKDLPVNTVFYFSTDTNRTYAWTKLSDTTAKNAKTGASQTVSREALVHK